MDGYASGFLLTSKGCYKVTRKLSCFLGLSIYMSLEPKCQKETLEMIQIYTRENVYRARLLLLSKSQLCTFQQVGFKKHSSTVNLFLIKLIHVVEALARAVRVANLKINLTFKGRLDPWMHTRNFYYTNGSHIRASKAKICSLAK